MNPGAPRPKDGGPLLLAPNDNSGERAAPSVGVPGPSVREIAVIVMCPRTLAWRVVGCACACWDLPRCGFGPDPDPAGVVKALLEHHDSCQFAYFYDKFGSSMKKSVRPSFEELLNREIDRYDKDENTVVNVDGVKYKKAVVAKSHNSANEYSVVTLLVLVSDIKLDESLNRSIGHLKSILQTIQTIPKKSIEVSVDNSGERAAPSVGVPGPSVRERGVAAGWAPAKQHRKGGLAPTAPPV
ncbi:hypothetical protein AgCh_024789 [Apium graveolens]